MLRKKINKKPIAKGLNIFNLRNNKNVYCISKNKKAMMVGQIFIYALSLFVVVMILIYGYRIIMNFMGSSSDVEHLQFRRNLENLIKRYTTEFGSVGYRDLVAPGDVKQLCFTDYYSSNDNLRNCNSNPNSNFHPVIRNSFIPGAGLPREMKNVFLIDVQGNMINSEFFGNISVEGLNDNCNYLCINSTRGRFPLKIRGMGVGVRIADATP